MNQGPRKRNEPERKPYRPEGNSLVVWESTDPEILFCGPVRCGKTRTCLEKIHYLCMTYPGCRVLILRQTRRSLAQSVLLTFERDVANVRAAPFKPSNATRENRYSYIYKNGSEIVVGGLDDPSKYLSGEFDIIYIAQAEEINLDFLAILKTRLSNYVLPVQQLLMDSNPRGSNHPLYLRCTKQKATTYVEARWCDNPKYCVGSGALPPRGDPPDFRNDYWTGQTWTKLGVAFMIQNGWTPEGIDYIKSNWTTTGHMFDRLILGKHVNPEGARFKGASRFIQGFETKKLFPNGIPPDWPRWTSGDWGRASPYCHLWWALGPDGTRYVYAEDYETDYEADEQAGRIVEVSAGDHHYSRHMVDRSMWSSEKTFGGHPLKGPAAKQYQKRFEAENAKLGYSKFGPLVKGPSNQNECGFVTLDANLRNGSIKIELGCTNTWNEVENAVYFKDPTTGMMSDLINPNPTKKACPDHALVCLVYGDDEKVVFTGNQTSDTMPVDYDAVNAARMKELADADRAMHARPTRNRHHRW